MLTEIWEMLNKDYRNYHNATFADPNKKYYRGRFQASLDAYSLISQMDKDLVFRFVIEGNR